MVSNHPGFGTMDPRRTAGIIAGYEQGMSMRALAKRYHVSAERIRQILRARRPKVIRRPGRPNHVPAVK